MLAGGFFTFLAAMVREGMRVTWLVAFGRLALVIGGTVALVVAIALLVHAALGEFRR